MKPHQNSHNSKLICELSIAVGNSEIDIKQNRQTDKSPNTFIPLTFREGGKWMREKMMFLVVWLKVKRGKILAGSTSFLSFPSKTQSLQIGQKIKVKSGKKKFGQNWLHFLFFGYLNLTVNVAYLPTQKKIDHIFLGWLFAFFFFFFF